jgi:hypothetical protein
MRFCKQINLKKIFFLFESFINAYVGELITEEMATKRDFKYLAILDHTSHLCTTDNKKRKQPMKNSFNDVRIVVDGKNSFRVICFRGLKFDSVYFNITV